MKRWSYFLCIAIPRITQRSLLLIGLTFLVVVGNVIVATLPPRRAVDDSGNTVLARIRSHALAFAERLKLIIR